MARLVVGSLLACASLVVLGCGKSSSDSNSNDDAGRGGTSGSPTTGGSSGSSGTGGSAGTSDGLEPYFEPGTRLKPIVIAAAPGLDIIDRPLESGWHDSELDFDCYFAPDEAGVERCFPASLVFVDNLTFADASCTRPTISTKGSGPCDRLRYQYLAVENIGETCGLEGFHVSGELPATTSLFFMSNGECLELGADAAATHVYELEAVPPQAFVGMQRNPRPRAPGLDAYVREGDDGSWQVIAYFDPARQSACFDLSAVLSSPSKCIPPYAASSGYFDDSACEVRISEIRTPSCSFEAPNVLLDLHYDDTSCPPTQAWNLYELGERREAVPYTIDTSGACVTTNREPSEAWIQGAPIDPSTVPSLEKVIVGDGPVLGRFSGYGGVPFHPDLSGDGPFIDAASDTPCRVLAFSDGALFCVPSSFFRAEAASVVYESSTCSGPRVLPFQPRGSCFSDVPLPGGIVLVDGSTDCSGESVVTETIPVAGVSTATTLYTTNHVSGCGPFALEPGAIPLLLGDYLDPALTFSPVARTIRE